MITELDENDKTALTLLLKYCFYRNWYNFLLVNFSAERNDIYYSDMNEDIVLEVSITIADTLTHLKSWSQGCDISEVEVDDLATIKAFNSAVQDRGVLIVIKKLFHYADELHLITDAEDYPKVEKLLHHIRRCTLLIDLWYAGEDLTYFGTMLAVP